MLRFHESPISIFDEVQQLTDGDYALVHLLEENEEYAEKFIEAREKNRTIFLDNSVYELGKPEPKLMKKWAKIIKPTAYFVPDYLFDKDKTIESFETFPKLSGERIGVIQGKNLEELIECYQYMSEHADIIAISCDCLGYGVDLDRISQDGYDTEKALEIRNSRKVLFTELEKRGLLNYKKKHHLLGCILPQDVYELKYLPYIYSIDTSSPIFQPLLNNFYDDKGELQKKMSQRLLMQEGQKLFELEVTKFQLKEIKSAIEVFKKFTDFPFPKYSKEYRIEKEIHRLVHMAYVKGLQKYGDNPITFESNQLRYDNLTSLQHIDNHLVNFLKTGNEEDLSHFFFRLLNSRQESYYKNEGISIYQLQKLYKDKDRDIYNTLMEFRKLGYLKEIINPCEEQIDKE